MISEDWQNIMAQKFEVKKIQFKKVEEVDGNIVVAEVQKQIPFEINRFFYIFGVPKGQQRANHASVDSDFVLVAIRGSVQVLLSDGDVQHITKMDDNSTGLLVPRGTWMRTFDFSEDCVLFVLASSTYENCHYISDFAEFRKYKGLER